MLGDARLYLAWVALSYFTLTAMATLQGSLRFTALNLLRPVVVAGTLIGVLLLAVDNRVSVHAMVVVYLAANALAVCLAWAAAIKAVRPGWPDPRLLKPLLSFAARAQLGHIATVANERVDVALLSILVPAAEVGQYAAALGVAAALRLFGSSFALVALPALASEQQSPAGRETIGRLCRTTAWSSAAAGIVAVLAVPVLIPWLFGAAFAAAVLPGQILVVAVVILNVLRVLSAGLKGLGLPAQASLGDAIGAALTVALLLALVPTFGLTGASLAAVLSYLASLGYLVWIVRGRLAVPPLARLVGRGSVAA